MAKTASAPRRNAFTKSVLKKVAPNRARALRFAALHHLIDAAIDLEADHKVVECAEKVAELDRARIEAAEWRFLQPHATTLLSLWRKRDFNQVAYALGHPYGARLTRSAMADIGTKVRALSEPPKNDTARAAARDTLNALNDGNAACIEILSEKCLYEPSARAAPLVAALRVWRIATTGRPCACPPCVRRQPTALEVMRQRGKWSDKDWKVALAEADAEERLKADAHAEFDALMANMDEAQAVAEERARLKALAGTTLANGAQ